VAALFGGRQTRLLVDSLVLGVVGALAAQLFTLLLDASSRLFLIDLAGYVPPTVAGTSGTVHATAPPALPLIPLATTLGGLLSGLLVYSFAPEAEGHGTDTAVKAFHHGDGVIRKRIAPVKMLASAITIGSGGSAGREGPTALISAAFGSAYADVLRRPTDERRLLTLIGMAAGLSAVFRSPIGTAVFAVEVLYRDMEFETRALLFALLSAITAYAVGGLAVGWEPLFRMPASVELAGAADYAWYVVLGAAAGILGTIVPTVFYRTRDAFEHLAIPRHFKPALGGLGVGIVAYALPQVLGGGYAWIQDAIDGRLAAGLLMLLMAAKLVTFALTVGSGGSGGVFAPTLYIGAMLGALLARSFHLPAAAFAVVGMAALFGSAARVPIATLLMVTEMTGGYRLLVPAATAVTLATLVQSSLSAVLKLRYPSLYESQVAAPAHSPAHHTESLRHALSLLDGDAVPISASIGHLNLYPLLAAGVPVQLPGGRKLVFGSLREDSACVATTVGTRCLFKDGGEGRIVAIAREKQFIVPDADTELRAGDQLVIFASAETLELLRNDLVPTRAAP
jgi:chloride channel protein, CIC family